MHKGETHSIGGSGKQKQETTNKTQTTQTKITDKTKRNKKETRDRQPTKTTNTHPTNKKGLRFGFTNQLYDSALRHIKNQNKPMRQADA